MKKFILFAVFSILCLATRSTHSNNADLVISNADFFNESEAQTETGEPYRLSYSEIMSYLTIIDSLTNESLIENDTIK